MICALLARGKFKPELAFQAGTSSYFQPGISSYNALYKYANIEYVEVPEDHGYNMYEYVDECVRTFCDVRMSYLVPVTIYIYVICAYTVQ